MSIQSYFKYNFNEINYPNNFFVNETNYDSYNAIVKNDSIKNILLVAPPKSGKSHLLNIWSDKYDVIKYNGNLKKILYSNKHVAIDDLFKNINEENIFHIINHCNNQNLKILITSHITIDNYKFNLLDLKSRLKTFYPVTICNPNDEMVKIILTKLLYDKQFIIKNTEIFDFLVKRIERSYLNIYDLVNKLDKISLEKKRQLTIPLIKEIL